MLHEERKATSALALPRSEEDADHHSTPIQCEVTESD